MAVDMPTTPAVSRTDKGWKEWIIILVGTLIAGGIGYLMAINGVALP